jgi:hypothetical protein
VDESVKVRICRDCEAEGRIGKPLDAPYQGPRCFRHHKAHKRAQAARAAARRREAIYGISESQYRAILILQGGGCAVCGRPPAKRRLAVDHDHTCCPGRNSCGKCVRMLACWTCNKFLEHIKDDPRVLERAAQYLRNPPARMVARTERVA